MAYGRLARHEAEESLKGLRANMPGLKVKVIEAEMEAATSDEQRSRMAKVRLDELSPFETTLYIDADTRPQADLSAGFEMIESGFDLAIAPSGNQGEDCLWHVNDKERRETIRELGYQPLQLQAGLFFFGRSERTRRFFEAWREEWERWRDQDQAAFLRALKREPVRIWLLGRPWNGGAMCQHWFGRCRG